MISAQGESTIRKVIAVYAASLNASPNTSHHTMSTAAPATITLTA